MSQNPATGPLYVRGADPGDLLAVDILDIEVADRGLMVAIPGLGAMGHMIKETEVKFIPVAGGVARFNETVRLPKGGRHALITTPVRGWYSSPGGGA